MDSLAVRATINVQLEAMLGEVTMRVYRERKWFLPLEENEVEAEIEPGAGGAAPRDPGDRPGA